MHAEAREYVRRTLAALPKRKSVIEVGSRDINGTVRDLLGKVAYTGLDLQAGPNVDVVGDALEYTPPAPVDTVLCLEVLEHAEDPAALCWAAHDWLKDKGVLVLTAAAEGRPKHSGVDGGPLRENETYQHISEADLREWLEGFAKVEIETNERAHDIYALARK